jgi:hypothetical protein
MIGTRISLLQYMTCDAPWRRQSERRNCSRVEGERAGRHCCNVSKSVVRFKCSIFSWSSAERWTIEIKLGVPVPTFRSRLWDEVYSSRPCCSIILHCRTSIKKVVPTNQGHRLLCAVSRLSSQSTSRPAVSAVSPGGRCTRQVNLAVNDFSTNGMKEPYVT